MKTSLFFDEDRKYGFNKIIRLLTGFPEDRPLPCRYEHGHWPSDEKPVNDLRTKKRLMLVFNKRRLDLWLKYSNKRAVIIGSPFVHYRRHMGIERVAEPKGTLAFPLHSTKHELAVFERGEYCAELRKLPEEFQPVKICVHEHDIVLGYDALYRSEGFEVVSAGVREDDQFVDRFYDLLRQSKYATSNAFGSYLFYAVEMGIPFFTYGSYSHISTLKDGREIASERMTDMPCGRYIEELFATYPDVGITEEQRAAVAEEIGVDDAMGFSELRHLLDQYYWRQRIGDWLRLPIRHPRKFLMGLFGR